MQLASNVADHGVNHLGFDQEGGGFGPGARGDGDAASALGEPAGIEGRERTGPGDAGSARILEIIALAGVERDGAFGRFPFAIR